MNTLLPILLVVALVATLGVLLAGIVIMGRGGEANRKYGNILMRWRVILQFAALVLLGLIMLLAGR